MIFIELISFFNDFIELINFLNYFYPINYLF